jgi:hypothetical protein
MAYAPRPRPLADLVDGALGRTLAAQGFAAADILVAWGDIVGERLAATTQPLKIEWQRRRPGADPTSRPDPATLVVRVESAFALDVQHLAPVIVERVNAHYGWRCVGKLVLKQGPVRRAPGRPAPPAPLPEAERMRIADAVAGVDDEGLRGALDRLGHAVVGSVKAAPTKP